MKVRIHRNLNRHCWSILGPDGLLLKHASEAILEEAKFVIQPAGRRRALKQGRRNVHAYVKGELYGWSDIDAKPILKQAKKARRVRYKLYDGNGFEDESRNLIIAAVKVWFKGDGSVWATPTELLP